MQVGHRTLHILCAVLVGQHQKCSLLLVNDDVLHGDLQMRTSSAETLGAGQDRIRRPRMHSGLRLTQCEPKVCDRGMGAAKRPSPSSSSTESAPTDSTGQAPGAASGRSCRRGERRSERADTSGRAAEAYLLLAVRATSSLEFADEPPIR